jgi:chromosome segregation ATPase
MDKLQKSPVKVVHWDAPVNEDELNDGSDSSNENTNETNIVVSIKSSPSKRSSAAPRKKRRPSSTTQMLEDELKAEAKRRTSSVIDEANLALMVSSLRRQNEDLKAKLQSSNGGGESSIIDKRIMEQKEIECTELKKSVGNLKRLLNIEIDERKAQETQTLELLEDVKKKWHGRDDKRQQQLRKDLKDANQVVVDMELELQRNQSDLDSAKNDIESLQTVKQSLKAKLKECKGKLEATVVNYDAKAELVSRLEQRITEVEAEVKATSKNDRDKKRRASIVISDNRAELETVREDMDRLAAQKRDLEDDLSQLRLEAKTYSKRLESLQQDYEAHLARCDSRLLDLTSENSKLREENDGLENRVMTLEAKLEAKARALEKLEDVQSELEKKIPSKDSLDAYAEKKTNDKNAAIQKENEELSNDLRYAKIEVRLAEKRQKESEDRVKIFRDLYTEQKKKAKKVEDEDNGVQDQVAKLEREKEAEKREKEALSERNETLKTRLDGLRKEVDSLRSEANSQKDLEDELTEVKDKLAKARKQLDGLHGVDK